MRAARSERKGIVLLSPKGRLRLSLLASPTEGKEQRDNQALPATLFDALLGAFRFYCSVRNSSKNPSAGDQLLLTPR